MKYFAKLGLNSKVVSITHILDSNAPTEKEGIEFLHKQTNYPFWVQTFKDRSQRKHYAGIGFIYDEDRDVFIPKQPYSSWVLDISNATWISPIGNAPEITGEQLSQNESNTHLWDYDWNDTNQSWDLINRLA